MKIKEDLMFIKGNLSGLMFIVKNHGISDCLEMLIENIDEILKDLEVNPLEDMEPKFEGKIEGFSERFPKEVLEELRKLNDMHFTLCRASPDELKRATDKVMSKYKGALEGLADK